MQKNWHIQFSHIFPLLIRTRNERPHVKIINSFISAFFSFYQHFKSQPKAFFLIRCFITKHKLIFSSRLTSCTPLLCPINAFYNFLTKAHRLSNEDASLQNI